jgi:hypothetical protein
MSDQSFNIGIMHLLILAVSLKIKIRYLVQYLHQSAKGDGKKAIFKQIPGKVFVVLRIVKEADLLSRSMQSTLCFSY